MFLLADELSQKGGALLTTVAALLVKFQELSLGLEIGPTSFFFVALLATINIITHFF